MMERSEAVRLVTQLQARNMQLGGWPTGGPECQASVNATIGEAIGVVLARLAELEETLVQVSYEYGIVTEALRP